MEVPKTHLTSQLDYEHQNLSNCCNKRSIKIQILHLKTVNSNETIKNPIKTPFMPMKAPESVIEG